MSNTNYETGLIFFKNENYLAAREVFLQAELENPNDETILYNLGVVNYKLGFFPSAKQYFIKLEKNEHYAPIAYYNLALIDFRMNKEDSAKNWLNKSLTTNPSSNIKRLATNLLNKSNSSDKFSTPGKTIRPTIASSHLTTFLKSSYGYNDNVTQYLVFSKTKTGDQFYNIQMDSLLKASSSIHFQASAYFDIYDRMSNFDTSLYSASLKHEKQLSRFWRLQTSGSFGKQFIDNQPFQQLFDLKFYSTLSLLKQLTFNTSYRIRRITIQDSRYTHLDGIQQQISPGLQWALKQLVMDLSYVYEINDRRDFWVNNQMSSSFSPQTHHVHFSLLLYSVRFNAEFFSTGGLSTYPERNILYPNSDFPRQVKHKSLFTTYGIRLSYLLVKKLFAIGHIKYERNFSNIRDYRYEKRVYQLGFSWQF